MNKFLMSILGLLVLVGCAPENQTTDFNITEASEIIVLDDTTATGDDGLEGAPLPSPPIKSSEAICDPFGNIQTSQVSTNNGIRAKLYSAGQSVGSKIADYQKESMLVSENLIFSSINVPIRNFTEGFTSNSGDSLKDANGEKLIEYFSVAFKGIIKLDPEVDAPGIYEFAIVSDDGSIFRIKNAEGVYTESINNDGVTSARMGCSPYKVSLSHTSEVEFELDYLQAPRTEIAVVLLFRKVADTAEEYQANPTPYSKYCGVAKGYGFFSGNEIIQGLKDEGFRVLSPKNYFLPSKEEVNPCL